MGAAMKKGSNQCPIQNCDKKENFMKSSIEKLGLDDKLSKMNTVSGDSVKQSTDDNPENSNQTILVAEQGSKNNPPLKKTETEPFTVSNATETAVKERRFSGSKIPEKRNSKQTSQEAGSIEINKVGNRECAEDTKLKKNFMKNSNEIFENQLFITRKNNNSSNKFLNTKEDPEETRRSAASVEGMVSTENVSTTAGGISNRPSSILVKSSDRSVQMHSLVGGNKPKKKVAQKSLTQQISHLSPILRKDDNENSPNIVSPNFFLPTAPKGPESKFNLKPASLSETRSPVIKPQHYRLNLLEHKDKLIKHIQKQSHSKEESRKNPINISEEKKESVSSENNTPTESRHQPIKKNLSLNKFETFSQIEVDGDQISRLDLENYSFIIEGQNILFEQQDEQQREESEGDEGDEVEKDEFIRGRNGKVKRQLTIFTGKGLDVISESECPVEERKERRGSIKRKVEAKFTYTTASNISPTHEKLLEKASSMSNKEKIMAPLSLYKLNGEYQGRRDSLKKLSMKTFDEITITNLRKKSLKTQTQVPKTIKEFQGQRAKKKINNFIILKAYKSEPNKRIQLALDRDQNKYYVLKVIQAKDVISASNRLGQDQKFLKHIAKLKKIENENMIKLIQVLEDEEKKKLYFVLEYASTGVILSKEFWRNSIRMYNKQNGGDLEPADCETFPNFFEAEVARSFFIQVLRAVLYSNFFLRKIAIY